MFGFRRYFLEEGVDAGERALCFSPFLQGLDAQAMGVLYLPGFVIGVWRRNRKRIGGGKALKKCE